MQWLPSPAVLLTLCFCTLARPAWGTPPTAAPPTPAPGLLLVAIDSRAAADVPALISALHDSAAGPELELRIIAADSAAGRSTQIQRAATVDASRLAGILLLSVVPPAAGDPPIVIEVLHTPFGRLTPQHLESPEYSFKFAPDSARLAIGLHQALRPTRELGAVTLRLARGVRDPLPSDLARRTVQLHCDPALVTSPAQARQLVAALRTAAAAPGTTEDAAVMGLLPDVARRHAQPSDINIEVRPFIYPDRELTDEEQAQRDTEMQRPIATVHPLESGLYYITSLKPLTPYTLVLIDRMRAADDVWHELARIPVLTASLPGVVRTVPGLHADYEPATGLLPAESDAPPKPARAAYVITGATIFDGTNARPRFVADVAVADDRIIAVGDLADLPRDTTIDGRGLFLMPGFIDIHSHADEDVLKVPDAPTHIRQGITTVLGGNCSFSPLGIGAFLRDVEIQGTALNLGELIGNRPVRKQVIGERKGQPTYEEVYRQKELVDLAMEEGAFGMSSGLIYAISEEAHTWELAELAKQLKPYGGFYASHIRGETDEVLDAAREAIFIGELADVPVQISHMKVLRTQNWGAMPAYVELIRAARARGLDVLGDQYPWRASGPAAHRKLYDLLVREAIRNAAPETILLKDLPGRFAKYGGRPLPELLAGEQLTPAALIAELNLTADSDLHATFLCLSDADVCHALQSELVMVCTDSGLVSAEAIASGACRSEHPRKFRTYPEFFARYVRDRGVCSWELAVYKCTGLPASRMQLADRGVIRPGACADLVLLDPVELDPVGDFRDQTIPPRGVRWVFVNGEPALRDGELTGVRAGRALRAR